MIGKANSGWLFVQSYMIKNLLGSFSKVPYPHHHHPCIHPMEKEWTQNFGQYSTRITFRRYNGYGPIYRILTNAKYCLKVQKREFLSLLNNICFFDKLFILYLVEQCRYLVKPI